MAKTKLRNNELLRGLIQLHVLHHASDEAIYGLGMIEELRRHGYAIGPGTLYALPHRLTDRGYLRACGGGTGRATPTDLRRRALIFSGD